MTARRTLTLASGLALAALITASTAAAHGIGGRGDLPIPKDLFIGAAAVAVALSFAGVAFLWTAPSVARHAGGRALPAWTVGPSRIIEPLLRAFGLALFAVTIVAAWWGADDAGTNFAPTGVYVIFWVGVLWLSAVAGPIWRALNPWDTIVAVASGQFTPTPDPHPPDRSPVWSHWPAAAGLLCFTWLELAYVEPSDPRVVALAATLYSVAVLAMAARFGRRWLQTGEGFTVLFGLIAAIAPIGRRDDGRIILRVPFSGLATVEPRRGTVAVLLVVLGGTTFDGVSRTSWYGSLVRLSTGWERTAINTLGLVLVIAGVSAVYLGAAWLVAVLGKTPPRAAAADYIHTLAPIALAYSVAHYFSLFVFQGQAGWQMISDPLGRGWDLFGTVHHQIDYLALTAGQIAGVQTIAMIAGHVAGVVLAHDRGLERVAPSRVAVSQLPMLVAMIAFTVTGLTLLLSA